MAKPISDTVRQTILDLHSVGQSRNAIAKAAGVAPSTVSKVCHAEGLTFDRTQTRAAVAAKTMDVKAARAQLKEDLLADAQRLRKQLWEPAMLQNFGGKDNTFAERRIPQPQFVDKKNILTAVALAIDKSLKLEAVDANSEELTAVDAWLEHMTAGIDTKEPT